MVRRMADEIDLAAMPPDQFVEIGLQGVRELHFAIAALDAMDVSSRFLTLSSFCGSLVLGCWRSPDVLHVFETVGAR